MINLSIFIHTESDVTSEALCGRSLGLLVQGQVVSLDGGACQEGEQTAGLTFIWRHQTIILNTLNDTGDDTIIIL